MLCVHWVIHLNNYRPTKKQKRRMHTTYSSWLYVGVILTAIIRPRYFRATTMDGILHSVQPNALETEQLSRTDIYQTECPADWHATTTPPKTIPNQPHWTNFVTPSSNSRTISHSYTRPHRMLANDSTPKSNRFPRHFIYIVFGYLGCQNSAI